MNFLAAVNRVLRAGGILRGDTDPITTFSDLQHGATVQIAMIAIQDELTQLTADTLLPYERKTTGAISTAASTRSYALANDFVRFDGTPSLYDATNNRTLYEYSGGEDKLKNTIYNYKTETGEPWAWYFEAGTTKQISFFPVPNLVRSYAYNYESDSSVTNSTDTLPFQNEMEAQAFCRLAARRFKTMFEGKGTEGLSADPEHMMAKATLAALIVGKKPNSNYAPVYR